MKMIQISLFALSFVISAISLEAQDCLTYKYKRVEKFEIKKSPQKFPDIEYEYSLKINVNESSFRITKKPDFKSSGNVMAHATNESYINFKTDTKISNKEAFSSSLFVKEPIMDCPCILTGESKVNDKNIKLVQANCTHNDLKVVLWFDPSNKVKHNIIGITGVPGLIHELSRYNGSSTYTLVSEEKVATESGCTIDSDFFQNQKLISQEELREKIAKAKKKRAQKYGN